jgi:hypothetical protein
MSYGKEVYPVTNDLREQLKEILAADPKSSLWSDSNPEYSRNRIVDTALEYVGEYEHGSVDTEDLWPDFTDLDASRDNKEQIRLRIMAAVLEDFIGSLFMGLGGTKERDWTN